MKSSQKRTPTITLEQVMKALGDPVRMSVVKQLLNAENEEKPCGTFDYTVTKATFSHHIKILEDAGVIQTRVEGTRKLLSVHSADLKKKFPGLLELILKST